MLLQNLPLELRVRLALIIDILHVLSLLLLFAAMLLEDLLGDTVHGKWVLCVDQALWLLGHIVDGVPLSFENRVFEAGQVCGLEETWLEN